MCTSSRRQAASSITSGVTVNESISHPPCDWREGAAYRYALNVLTACMYQTLVLTSSSNPEVSRAEPDKDHTRKRGGAEPGEGKCIEKQVPKADKHSTLTA